MKHLVNPCLGDSVISWHVGGCWLSLKPNLWPPVGVEEVGTQLQRVVQSLKEVTVMSPRLSLSRKF